MTKKELVQRICRDCRMTRGQADRALASIARNLAAGLRRQGRVQFSGLGSFSMTPNLTRRGRNPQTGHQIRLRRRAAVRFTPNPGLQRRLR